MISECFTIGFLHSLSWGQIAGWGGYSHSINILSRCFSISWFNNHIESDDWENVYVLDTEEEWVVGQGISNIV